MWEENGGTNPKCITEGEVYAQDYKMPRLVHLYSLINHLLPAPALV